VEAGPHLNLFLLGFFDGLSSGPSISVTCRFPGVLYSIVISKKTLGKVGKVCMRAKWPIRPELILVSVA